MGRRVLVTGASGFVGRHLVPALVARGFSVIAPVRRAQPPQDGVDYQIVGDITDADWHPYLTGVDAVAHLAGLAHTRGAPEALYDSVNAGATLRFAGQCAGQVGRFVFLSSIRAVSGPGSVAPLGETSPALPTDAYGRSKLKAERGLAALGLPASVLRPVAVYGEGVKGNLARIARLAQMRLPLPFAGLRRPRSFLAVDNLVSAVCFALERVTEGAEIFVAADPAPSHVAGLLAGLREGLGRSANLFAFPPVLLGAAASLAGQRQSWATLAGPMAAPPDRLIQAGWRPPIATSSEGARLWGAAIRRAAL